MDHITQVKRKLKKLLMAQLPAKLAQLDVEADDGVHCKPPYRCHTTDMNALEGHPTIELVGQGSFTDGQAVIAEVYSHRIAASVTVGGDDEEALTVELERYIYAIRKIARDTLLADGPTPDVPTGPIDTGNEVYTALATPPGIEVPFVKGAYIELIVKTVE